LALRQHRCQQWALLGIILLAFVLRVYDLGRQELWFDEALSAIIAGKGWAGILAYTLSAPFEHPPPYYLTLYSWMNMAGASEFALRFFSMFWGVLLIPLLYRFMAPWGGHSFALLVALVAALSTPHIAHSQSARMYTLLPVLGVLLLICFFRGLGTRRSWWWVAFLVVSIVGTATHYYFALMLLVPMVLLLLGGQRYRRLLVLVLAVQLGCVLLVAGWFWFAPGFRQAVQQVLMGEGANLSGFGQRIMHTAGGLLLEPPAVGHLALGGVALLGVFLWPLSPRPRAHTVSGPNLVGGPSLVGGPNQVGVGTRGFFLVWLLVPWLAALAIPYWLQDRHLAYVWPAFYALVAGGLLAIRARSRPLFAAALLLMGATCGYGLYLEQTEAEFEFGRIMSHIEDRAMPDDLVIMNQPATWPLVSYYSHRDLAVAYVPANAHPLSQETVDQPMRSLVSGRSRVWLGPIGAWTADPESLTEEWLATHAYQAHKEWFPGSGSAALYFTANSLQPLAVDPATDWEGRVRLLSARSSPLAVLPGDAVRLSFAWQASQRIDSSHLVSVFLVDEMGRVWAERQSEPCSGWCPTDTWEPGAVLQDRHALLIPPGTPPGSYRLQVAWYASAEGRELAAAAGGQRVDLGEVQVIRDSPLAMRVLPGPVIQHPLQVEFGEQISLLGFDLDPRPARGALRSGRAQAEIPVGETVVIDLHWRAQTQPVDNYTLRLELAGSEGHVVASWDDLPSAGSLPTSDWQTGEYLRGLHRLGLPYHVAPGQYQLRLKLLDADGQPLLFSGYRSHQVLGGLIRWQAALEAEALELATLRVTEQPERSHNLDVPPIGHPLHVQLDQHVELLGYDLVTDSAMPGGQVELTLFWRGGGATDLPYKVFSHLSDGRLLLAQHDGPPGDGCCPTDTWVKGEVVVDRHVIPLAVDLLPGTYHLTTGMYDEPSLQRLPILDTQGRQLDEHQVFLADVVVRPSPPPKPTPVRPHWTHRVYLPLVEVSW
jgi:hypothetical protein